MIGQTKPQDPDVRKVIDASEISWKYVNTDMNGHGSPFEIAQRAALAYERVLDPDNWQTTSEVYLPYALAAVEQSLAQSLQQIFTNEEFIGIKPRGIQVPPQILQDTRDYLLYVMREQMRVWVNAYNAIKGALKLGCGYNYLDLQYITPWKFRDVLFRDKSIKIRDLVQDFGVQAVPRLRNMPFAQVMPSPGGGAMPDERDWIIVLDYLDEDEMQFLIADENSGVEADFRQLKKEALDNRIDGYSASPIKFWSTLTKEGTVPQNEQRSKYSNLPIKFPVVKYLGKDAEIWVANGTTKIMKLDSGPQLLHKPLLKASCRLDGDQWFNDGIISANEDVFDATNIMFNVIMDMVDFNSRPRLIKDARLGELNMEPWGQTAFAGPMDQPPFHQVRVGGIDQETVAMLNRLDHSRQIGTHQPDAMQGSPQTGLVRGGQGAVESLMQSTNAVQQVTGRLLEMTYIEDLAYKTLFLLQTGLDDTQVTFEVSRFDEQGNRNWDVKTLTREDLQKDFRVEIMTSDKYQNSIADYQRRLNILQLAINSDPTIAREIAPLDKLAYAMGSRKEAERLMSRGDPEAYDRAMAEFAALKERAVQESRGGTTTQTPRQRGQLGGGGEGDSAQQAQAGGVQV